MALMIPRSNHGLAAIVDQGIVIAEQFGLGMGGRFMRKHNVPLDIALRVLASPSQRRNYK